MLGKNKEPKVDLQINQAVGDFLTKRTYPELWQLGKGADSFGAGFNITDVTFEWSLTGYVTIC